MNEGSTVLSTIALASADMATTLDMDYDLCRNHILVYLSGINSPLSTDKDEEKESLLLVVTRRIVDGRHNNGVIDFYQRLNTGVAQVPATASPVQYWYSLINAGLFFVKASLKSGSLIIDRSDAPLVWAIMMSGVEIGRDALLEKWHETIEFMERTQTLPTMGDLDDAILRLEELKLVFPCGD